MTSLGKDVILIVWRCHLSS